MKNIIIATCLLLFSGCAATRSVEPEYAPIKTMSERPWYASFLGGENTITTIGDTVYVGDLDEWMEKRPAGSPRYDSIMSHEMVHSYRQQKEGTTGWLARYLRDKSFRWEEEQLGWYVQIRMYRRYGLRPNPEGIAKTLAGYSPSMVSYEEALQWVRDVLSGRWKPADGELPPGLQVP